MATLANSYRLIDDYGNSASGGGPGGGMSGQPFCADFTATTLANAGIVAYLAASIFQRPMRLGALGQFPTIFTLVTGVSPTVALTSVPSGIQF